MVIVQGTLRFEPQDRDAYLQQSLEQMETSRAEQGCIEYVLAADPLEADRVILSERWESTADLNAHTEALMARRAEAEPPPVQPKSVDFNVYEVTATASLG